MQEHEAIIARAAEIVAGLSAHTAKEGDDAHCVIAQTDLDGYPTAAAVTTAKADGIRTLWICTGLQSAKALRAQKDPRACLCFARAEGNITLVGHLDIRTDAQTRHDAWYPGMAHHFSGPDDPQYCVLVFTTERYNLLVDWKEARGTL